MPMKAVVGFDRKIKREWLDDLADQVALCGNPAELRRSEAASLRMFLSDVLAAEHPAETARGKTMTVLMRIWALVPERDRQLRQEAFELLKTIPSRDRIWLHWGMCLLAYPFFRDAATVMGRLLKLQDEFTLGQMQRRLIDRWGERSTVARAFQRLARSMVEWRTLADADARGSFRAAEGIVTASKPLELWFVRACHQASEKEAIEAEHLLRQPLAFPFKLSLRVSDLRRSKEFEFHRQGIDIDMVVLPWHVRANARRLLSGARRA